MISPSQQNAPTARTTRDIDSMPGSHRDAYRVHRGQLSCWLRRQCGPMSRHSLSAPQPMRLPPYTTILHTTITTLTPTRRPSFPTSHATARLKRLLHGGAGKVRSATGLVRACKGHPRPRRVGSATAEYQDGRQ
jgi:hypothetical protein